MSECTLLLPWPSGFLLTQKQAVTAPRAPRTPRPATAAASLGTSPATARPVVAAAVAASPVLSATRWAFVLRRGVVVFTADRQSQCGNVGHIARNVRAPRRSTFPSRHTNTDCCLSAPRVVAPRMAAATTPATVAVASAASSRGPATRAAA
ncbi:hypothetical protein N658DRAFT_180685 [Parathielavia hyrcaniae]|uniref:Uncharacterized protein n=1 Tax=Parathielavia hyrcaniae TaxID=113614 RepID=A0AAN6Q962_9PEZI|nr:hypothetical protein N658DRAFT_180685 [Parathielavia hyrcaniae]